MSAEQLGSLLEAFDVPPGSAVPILVLEHDPDAEWGKMRQNVDEDVEYRDASDASREASDKSDAIAEKTRGRMREQVSRVIRRLQLLGHTVLAAGAETKDRGVLETADLGVAWNIASETLKANADMMAYGLEGLLDGLAGVGGGGTVGRLMPRSMAALDGRARQNAEIRLRQDAEIRRQDAEMRRLGL